ncbi:hypothetical protein Pvag_1784 [Pantoea vagans C9-1]|nr:hypothetical protein Pvag_1784 [Pantoea vagans C9-1]
MSEGEDRFQVSYAGVKRGRRPAFLFSIFILLPVK